MDQLSAVDAPFQLVFHNDEDTPMEFVMQLFRDVFGEHAQDAFALTLLIGPQEKGRMRALSSFGRTSLA